MQERLEDIIRKKKDIIVEEIQSMTDDTPATTRAFATGYVFAMQEILIQMELDKRDDKTAAQLNSMFRPK